MLLYFDSFARVISQPESSMRAPWDPTREQIWVASTTLLEMTYQWKSWISNWRTKSEVNLKRYLKIRVKELAKGKDRKFVWENAEKRHQLSKQWWGEEGVINGVEITIAMPKRGSRTRKRLVLREALLLLKYNTYGLRHKKISSNGVETILCSLCFNLYNFRECGKTFVNGSFDRWS